MDGATPLFERLAAAYVRGALGGTDACAVHPALFQAPLEALASDEIHALLVLGEQANLRLHRFKRTMGLPRVHNVLGVLRGIQPASVLDIGSGRGAFLWPLLDAFPGLTITALDILAHRVEGIEAVRAGGVSNLRVAQADVTALPYADASFDVVTMLEVLEHIPDSTRALDEVCRVANRFVILSVPSKPDTNPEHIHLFDAATLVRLLQERGCPRVKVDYVPGHLIAVARRSAP
jgi:2-polyprenyl-3-methyl-5-hydroxy-6-metoxy-1,4-benzoquinol methylase